ncbi:MAG: methyltransferase domain-containing protein [Chloroflexota bacterium]
MDADRQKVANENSEEQESTIFYVYGDFEQDVLAQVRRETYGEDIGQFSWLTADEFRRFFERLDLDAGSDVLDVACGSGGPAIFMAQTTGCRVTGIDINEGGVNTGTQMAEARGVSDRVQFKQVDASLRLPFEDASFDAITCIDAINHMYNRAEVMGEWYRVLRPGGRFLFTDAVVVTGMLLRDEIMARSSSMGEFIFTPPGIHDHFIEAAGFIDLQVEDVTSTIATVSKNWHDARADHRDYLLEIESQAAFEDLQRMLAATHTLSSERRLSRFAYRARKPPHQLRVSANP